MANSKLNCIISSAGISTESGGDMSNASEVLFAPLNDDSLTYSYLEILNGLKGILMVASQLKLEKGEDEQAIVTSVKNGIWIYDRKIIEDKGQAGIISPSNQEDLNYFDRFRDFQNSIRKNDYVLPEEYWLEYVSDEDKKYWVKIVGEDYEKVYDCDKTIPSVPYKEIGSWWMEQLIGAIPKQLAIDEMTKLGQRCRHALFDAIQFGADQEEAIRSEKELIYKNK